MGLKGVIIGGALGRMLLSPLGALGMILGAALGSYLENAFRSSGNTGGRRRPTSGAARASVDNGMIFCASAAAMLAKLAKADGVVTANEIASVELAFARLGFSADARHYAINVFRRAKDDQHTIGEYAEEFAAAVDSLEVRELLYELLWDLACADGHPGEEELAMLSQLPHALKISPQWFYLYAQERLERSHRKRGRAGRTPPPRDALANAYATLGADASASNEELRRLYREKAKKHHPDALKAQGLPDEMIGRATEKMARVNAAWDEIRRARGLSR